MSKKKETFVDMSADELTKELAKARKVAHAGKAALAGLRAKSLKEARAAKKTVARIMTELTKRAKSVTK